MSEPADANEAERQGRVLASLHEPPGGFRVGDRFATRSHTLTAAEIRTFAELTGDLNPLHLDDSASPYGVAIAHGLLTVSLTAGLRFALDAPAGLVLYGLDRVRFVRPVLAGDEVATGGEVAAVEARADGRTLVRFREHVTNGRGETVCAFERSVLYPPRADVAAAD